MLLGFSNIIIEFVLERSRVVYKCMRGSVYLFTLQITYINNIIDCKVMLLIVCQSISLDLVVLASDLFNSRHKMTNRMDYVELIGNVFGHMLTFS